MSEQLGGKVTVQSLVDVVTERLEAAIVSGALAPGSRLSEQGLAASLGVSRGPLREAIRRLEGRKLLHRTPNIGVRVASLSLRNLHEVLQIRERLEGLSCALAARYMSDAQVAELSAIVARHEAREAEAGDTDSYDVAEDSAFHAHIVSACRNERLKEMLSDDLNFLFRLYSDQLGGRRDRGAAVLGEHRAIVAAIVARDPPAAEAAMREHLRNARRHVEEQIAEQEPDGVDAEEPARRPRVGSLGG
jgi:DNA-binding GntR family transcriptional regulator